LTRVEALRKRKRLTVEAVAFEAEVDKSTVSRIERCLVKPRKRTVKHVARGLEVLPLYLWLLIEADWADRTLAQHDSRESA
jgi:transcriptional regulator with XRE-family HTH domain